VSEENRNAALRKYVDLRRQKDELEAELSEVKAEWTEQMRFVHELLRKDGTLGATMVDLGPGYGKFRFTPGETITANIHDEHQLHQWIEAEGRGDELYFPDKLRKKPLNEMVREILNHENAEFPPGLDYTEVRKVTMTKLKD
jgi:hypothetical protein